MGHPVFVEILKAPSLKGSMLSSSPSLRVPSGKTQMEIAEELNISQAQVSRIEKGAIKQLKKVLK